MLDDQARRSIREGVLVPSKGGPGVRLVERGTKGEEARIGAHTHRQASIQFKWSRKRGTTRDNRNENNYE